MDKSLRVASGPSVFFCTVCISAFASLLFQMDAWQMHSSDSHTVPLRHRAGHRVSFSHALRSSGNSEGVTAQHDNEGGDVTCHTRYSQLGPRSVRRRGLRFTCGFRRFRLGPGACTVMSPREGPRVNYDCNVLSFSLLKMLKNCFVSCLGIHDRFYMGLHS